MDIPSVCDTMSQFRWASSTVYNKADIKPRAGVHEAENRRSSMFERRLTGPYSHSHQRELARLGYGDALVVGGRCDGGMQICQSHRSEG